MDHQLVVECLVVEKGLDLAVVGFGGLGNDLCLVLRNSREVAAGKRVDGVGGGSNGRVRSGRLGLALFLCSLGDIVSRDRSLVDGIVGGGGSLVGSIIGGGGSLFGSVVHGNRGLVSSIVNGGRCLVDSLVGGVLSLAGRVAHRVLSSPDVLLGQVSVFCRVRLNSLGCAASMLCSEHLDLRSLLVHHLLKVVHRVVDDFAVVDVDKRDKVHDRSGEQGKTPEGHDADEEVGNQSGCEYL